MSVSKAADNQFEAKTPFGLKNGRIYAVGDVESGLACGCVCPGCGTPLVARKGTTTWHFGHHKVVATMSCAESAIHAAAKQVLLDANWLRVPEKRITLSALLNSGTPHTKSVVLLPSRNIRFEYCREEVWETNIRPDVVGFRGKKKMLVEMYFTHKVDDAKRIKMVALGLPALEIDLSNLALGVDFEMVKQRVLHDIAEKTWLFYPGENEATAALQDALDEQVKDLNLAHEAADQRQEDARQNAAERTRRKISEDNARYKALPLAEKERQLRESLSISGRWPHYLNLASHEASAIREIPRIWQTAVFLRFIFKMEKAGVRLHVRTIRDWVAERFGLVGGRAPDALSAVVKFLASLRVCGFLEKSAYSPYETEYYKVVHDKLAPPSRTMNTEAPAALMRSQPVPATTNIERKIKPNWHWCDSWPRKADILDSARAFLAISPHASLLSTEIANMSQLFQEESPLDLAVRLEKQGVPKNITLDLLVKLKLIRQLPRTGYML